MAILHRKLSSGNALKFTKITLQSSLHYFKRIHTRHPSIRLIQDTNGMAKTCSSPLPKWPSHRKLLYLRNVRTKITEIDSILCFIEPFDERLNQKSRQNGQMNEWASKPSLNIYFIYFYVFFCVVVTAAAVFLRWCGRAYLWHVMCLVLLASDSV